MTNNVPYFMTVDYQIIDKGFLQVIFFILESTEAFLKFVSNVIVILRRSSCFPQSTYFK